MGLQTQDYNVSEECNFTLLKESCIISLNVLDHYRYKLSKWFHLFYFIFRYCDWKVRAL